MEFINSIYLGHKISGSLLNTIQAEELGFRVDTRPKTYYPNDVECQSLHFTDIKSIPVLHEGVLSYIPIIRPKQ